MALYCYLCPIENAGIDPSLSRSVPPSVLTEVSKEVKEVEVRPKKRSTYLTVTAEEKAKVTTCRSASTGLVLPNISIDVISSHTQLHTKTLHRKAKKNESESTYVY